MAEVENNVPSAEAPKPKKKNWFVRHKVLTVVIVIVLIAVIAGAGGSSDTASNSTSTDNSSTNNAENTQADAMAKIGEPARDGKFEFVVKGIECGKKSVGTNEYLTKTPQGQFCLLTVNVKNIGDEPQTMFADNQYLFNAEGQKSSADGEATIYAGGTNSTWMNEINPGNAVEGVIVFDIPVGQTPVTAELHDSALSDGVKISLQ